MQRSVAACLASILELDVAEVPAPDAGHPQPWTVWRNWLGQRGLGLIPVGRLAPEEARRNLVTRGIDLNALVGKHFRVGGVECFGQRLCEPCAHLERLTAEAGKPGTLRALIHKRGLRADVLGDGEIRVGDEIAAR